MKSKLMFGVAAVVFSGSVLAGPVNVNTADAKALDKELSGVGPAIAAEIVKERDAHGPFKSGEDMAKRVKGFGDKALEKNRDNIKLGDK